MALVNPQTERLPPGGSDTWDQGPAGAILVSEVLPISQGSEFVAAYLEGGILKFTGSVSGKAFLAVGSGFIEAKSSNTAGYRKVALSAGALVAL